MTDRDILAAAPPSFFFLLLYDTDLIFLKVIFRLDNHQLLPKAEFERSSE